MKRVAPGEPKIHGCKNSVSSYSLFVFKDRTTSDFPMEASAGDAKPEQYYSTVLNAYLSVTATYLHQFFCTVNYFCPRASNYKAKQKRKIKKDLSSMKMIFM